MNCQEIRELLAENVTVASTDPQVKQHLGECAACRKILDRLREVDEALARLPDVAPPKEVLNRTVDAVKGKPVKRSQPYLKLALGASVPVVLLLGLLTVFGGKFREQMSSSANALAGNEDVLMVTDSSGSFDQGVRSFGENQPGTPPELGGGGQVGWRDEIDGKKLSQQENARGPMGDDNAQRYRLEDTKTEHEKDTWNREYVPPSSRATVETLITGERVKALHKRRDRTFQVIRLPSDGGEKKPEEKLLDYNFDSDEEEGEEDIPALEEEHRRKAEYYRAQGDMEKSRAYHAKVKEIGQTIDALKNKDGTKTWEDVTRSAKDLLREEPPDLSEIPEPETEDKLPLADPAPVVTKPAPGPAYTAHTGKEGLLGKLDDDGDEGGLDLGPKLAHQSRIVPQFKNGKASGFKVFAVRPGSDMDKIGIKNGDVIKSVNGLDITSPDKALEAYGNIRESNEVTLEIERNNQPVQLAVPADRIQALTQSGRGEAKGGKQTDQGFLTIQSAPLMAKVIIDGRQVENSPMVPLRLQAGEHRVQVLRPGYQPFDSNVRIRPGELTEVGLDPDEVSLDDLEFIPAKGYFANTYLPGDPAIAWLRQRLGTGLTMQGRQMILEQASAPYLQPFDAPTTDGLDVFLSADRPAVEGPARMILQVGLKGSLRHARRRAPLNAAVVVDLRKVPSEEDRRLIWTIVDAVANSQQAGDHFSLVVAGVEKPLRVNPSRFDLVAVRRNLARALEDVEESGARGTFSQALDAAYQAVGGEGADDAPLGANLVMVVSATALAEDLPSLQAQVHSQALAGINLNAIGVGSGADMQALGSLVMAGQGRRRLIADIKEAGRIVEAELSASGRVVARAVRLRIRLTEGVKLVEVFGSHPLDAVRAERVREAEKAIDQRVAKTLGIEADRGEDEDGIQIVIPAYYAGDDHVVLLDVVVPGPGKVADVRVRYKDLVGLRNAVASASLQIPSGTRPDDPMTRNVCKNLLAYRISKDLIEAARQLESGSFEQARQTVALASSRLVRLRGRFPELRDDPEMGRDARMLAEYVSVLEDHVSWQNDQGVRDHLVHSLAYAGRVKLPPGTAQ